MRRFLLIGLDGAEPTLLEPWMDAGYLPNLAGLRRHGAFLPLQSTTPPATFPAWTSCVTGVNPGKHGIFDFTEQVPGAYALRFVNATYRQAPALWNTLSEAGKRVAVLGVPGAYPPDPVNGVMVSGFDSPVTTRVDASFVHPRERYAQVQDWRFADFQESHITPGWHEKALPALLRGIGTKERIAQELMAEEPWDFFMLVFGESDTVAHHFWIFHDPDSPRHQPGFSDAIRQVYERLDLAVGRLIEAMGTDVVVGIVSDHGFGGAGTGVVHLNNWLAQQGHLRFAPDHDSMLKRLALRCVPTPLQGALFRRLQGMAAQAEGKSRFGGIDWAHTRAWSEELNYMPSVRINLQGREPMGQVKAADYDAYVADLCAELEAWEQVEHAWPRAALYDGPHVDKAPDILLSLALENGYSPNCLRSRGGLPFRRLVPEAYLGGKEQGMSGNHRNPGSLLLSEHTSAQRPHLVDIAPTVFSVLEVPGPPMDGRPLLGDASVTTESPPTSSSTPQPYTDAENAAVEARLRALGYLE